MSVIDDTPLLSDGGGDGHPPRKGSSIGDALKDALSHNHEGEVNVHEGDGANPYSDTWTFSWAVFWRFCGPGIMASIAFIDPGNLGADLQAGVFGGYSLGWLLFWSTVLGLFFQIIAGRIGVVTGKQLADISREEYNRPTSLTIWIFIELAIVASDIQEVVGSAIAFQLLFGLPLWIGVLLTGLDTFVFLLLERGGVRRLEAFFYSLVAVMTISFVVAWAMEKPEMGKILIGVAKPEVMSRAVDQAVGMLGAVIMPANLFLFSHLVLSRQVPRKSKGRIDEANFMNSLESSFGLFVSFIINLAVMTLFAQKFFKPKGSYCGDGIKCDDVGLREAGTILENALGHKAGKILWGVGLLAAGQTSTMTGTLAGQCVMHGFLQLKMKAWKRVALTRSIAIVPSIVVGIAAQNAMTPLNEGLNVLQSLVLPFALLPMLKLSAHKDIMGPYRLKGLWLGVAWFFSAVIVAINVYLVAQTVEGLPHTWWMYMLVTVLGVAYMLFCAYLTWAPVGNHVGAPKMKSKDRAMRRSVSASKPYDEPENEDVPWWVRKQLDSEAEAIKY